MGLKTQLSFFEDVLAFFMAIPGISWAPLFIITIGFGDLSIFLVGALTAFFPVVYNIYHGAREIDPNFRRLGRLLEYGKREKFFLISLPAVMNYALGALKLAVARTWRTIIAVEMIAASMYGLGYMIFDARELLNTEYMFAGILLSGAIYMALELVAVRSIERLTVERWGMKEAA
jgi:NitT/TauT family transport system permease protein